MGNLTFAAKVKRLTEDLDERLAAVCIAASMGAEASNLVKKLTGSDLFDEVDVSNEAEMQAMLDLLGLNTNGHAKQVKELLKRAEEAEEKYPRLATIVAPKEGAGKAPFDDDAGPGPIKPTLDVTDVDRARMWLLSLPPKAEINTKQLMEALSLDAVAAYNITWTLRRHSKHRARMLRCKKGIDGRPKLGHFVKLVTGEKATRAYLANRYSNVYKL